MIYVDWLQTQPKEAFRNKRILERLGNKWCHMFCDGPLEELHTLAKAIGLKRAWFQWKEGSSFPHYDLTPNMRAKAIQAGAKELSGYDELRPLLNINRQRNREEENV